VPGPDFPTGGIIQGRAGIIAAQRTGRGSITVRGKAEIEEIKRDKGSGRQAIIVTELPFMVNKARWIEATADLVRDKRLEGISDIRDESDRSGMRVVFELKRDAAEQVVLAHLYKHTALQSNFAVNMLAIVDGQPVLLTLRRAMQVFVDHRREVVTRRTLFDLREARARREIVEGLGLAVMNVDRVIAIIRASADTDEAKASLMAERLAGLGGFLERAGRPPAEVDAANARGFVHLTARQAQAILDMRLARLTGLEREKLEAEYKELWDTTDYLEGLLADDKKLMASIVAELRQLRADYADARRTQIVDADSEILTEELIDEEEMVVTRTHLGYIKRTPAREYQAQGRGGRGVTGATSNDGDFVADMFAGSTHAHLLLFTNTGRAFSKKVYELPEGARTAKGKPVINVLDLQDGETVVAMLPIGEFAEGQSVFFATQSGTVKKTSLDQFEKIRATGIKAITIDEDDKLIGVALVRPTDDVLLTSASGLVVRFREDKVRPMGRTAGGVRGINLRAQDRLVSMCTVDRERAVTLVTLCERGYGKRTELAAYPTKNRGGKGLIGIKTSARNGKVAAVRIAADDDHLILISDKGKLIRIRVADIPSTGRATQGVRIMRLDDGESVAAIERLAEPGDASGIAEAAPIEAAPEDLMDDGDTIANEVDDDDDGPDDDGV
jgi:DNA gyrase subunit A